MAFHARCGDRVTLLNNNLTAVRNYLEFNHGLLLSAEPLKDDTLFEVQIDRKINIWNGSLEVGVVTADPTHIELPATATRLRNSAWILSGSTVTKDGCTVQTLYGPDLDGLVEGDHVGVMRTSQGELVFYVNGNSLGPAAQDVPPNVYAVIDLYGRCVQVTVTRPSMYRSNSMLMLREASLEQVGEDPNNDILTPMDPEITGGSFSPLSNEQVAIDIPSQDAAQALTVRDNLRFHPRCGLLVRLSSNNKSAERLRPLDDYNNGVVMTHRPLYDDELFTIRIDRLVDKWSGSIEVGVTTHRPATMRFPSTMTNMDSGTIMMSGGKVLVNGHGTCSEYGNFNLDDLKEGDTVGMMRQPDGKLRFFVNGVDQGVAAEKVDPQIWAVIDLYGMTVKVTIVDPPGSHLPDISRVPSFETNTEQTVARRFRPRINQESLLFHSVCDSNVIVINDGKTAHRPHAFEYFSNGIVMTNRTLKMNELFQVRLDLVITKWAGSIEIGVTKHSCNEMTFPLKLSNSKSGTWVLSGEDVIRDSVVIIPQYVRNINKLIVGDTVGVMRKDMGILHFFVNGIDQGPAAFNIPDHVFGVIDLFGRAAQATIVDQFVPPPCYSPESPLSSESNATVDPEMCFHRVHGRNARLTRSRLTASRAAVFSEFNDAVLFSSRPLRECEMFELRIDKMVDCWIGSCEIGVTAIKPDDLNGNGLPRVAGTATDLGWETYILSGSAVMKDGECVRSGYPLDLDTLTVGSRVGVMRHADRSLHYYLDGMDQGKAWFVPQINIYAVVDLYGQCTQVTILQNEERGFNYNGCTNTDNSTISNPMEYITSPPPYSFSEYCGDNVCLSADFSVATRRGTDPTGALVFSAAHLAVNELFEVRVVGCNSPCAGNLRVGITDVNILNALVNRSLPPAIAFLPHFTAFVDGGYMKYSVCGGKQTVRSVSPSLDWLKAGDRVGLRKAPDHKVHVYLNSEVLDVAFEQVPDKVYVVMELYGQVTAIQAISKMAAAPSVSLPQPVPSQGASKMAASASNDAIVEETTKQEQEDIQNTQTKGRQIFTFHSVHGENIKLFSCDTVARRTSGYNNGIVVVNKPLYRGQTFKFRVDKLEKKWWGSVMVGAVGSVPDALPAAAVMLPADCWVLSYDIINAQGTMIPSSLGMPLDDLYEESVLSLHFEENGDLRVDVDRKSLASYANVPGDTECVYPVIDLYGQCTQVSVLLYPFYLPKCSSVGLSIADKIGVYDKLIINNQNSNDMLEPFDCEGEEIKKDRARLALNLVGTASELLRKTNLEYENYRTNKEDSETDISQELINSPASNNPNGTVSRPQDINRTENRTTQSLILFQKQSQRSFDNDNYAVDRHVQKSQSTQSFLDNRRRPSNSVRRQDNNVCEFNDHTINVLYTASPIILRESEFGCCDASDELKCKRNTNVEENSLSLDSEESRNNLASCESDNISDDETDAQFGDEIANEEADLVPQTNGNFGYLKNLIYTENQFGPWDTMLEAEWEEVGARCEYLHTVLKYWKELVPQYPNDRKSYMWGRVECYCSNCWPNPPPNLAGWVRISRPERREARGGEGVGGGGGGEAQRVYWQVDSTLVSWVLLGDARAVVRASTGRPSLLHATPLVAPAHREWYDEEGKPHKVSIGLEIDKDSGDVPQKDKLVATLIHLKSPLNS